MEKNDSESTLNGDVTNIPENLKIESTLNEDERQLEDLVIEIPENLEVTLRPEICIYRVPTAIRQLNEAAYNPQVISIGPIHHGKAELQEMEIQKLRYLKVFCERVEGKTQKEVVRELSAIIKECEDEIRHCYAEPCELGSTEFVKMILLDAVFLIELFLRTHDFSNHRNDFVIGQPSTRKAILSDLLLLENQLPYIFLKILYYETLSSTSVDFDTLASNGLTLFMPRAKLDKLGGVRHFVDMARSSVLGESMLDLPSKLDLHPSDDANLKYSASKLHQAGVKFEAITYDEGNMVEVQFVNGVLKMSVFKMPESSELFLRNIMAFEQCHYPSRRYFCNFIYLLDHLINTSEDVDLLVDAGIIVHWLGSNKVFADFINKLCQGLAEYESCYASIYENLNMHYKNRWNRRKATLRLVYFSNLWRGTATVAAAMLLLMALMQTITSIRSLF